jgi:AAHS family 4-hydroxybenzoate transporter-like MFS transporter
VAELTRRHFSFEAIFTVVAVPGLVAALALLVKRWVHPARASEASTPRAGGAIAH